MKHLTEEEALKFLFNTGLLFEINRTILHPLGIGLGIDNSKPEEGLKLGMIIAQSENDFKDLRFIKEALDNGTTKLKTFLNREGHTRIVDKLKYLNEGESVIQESSMVGVNIKQAIERAVYFEFGKVKPFIDHKDPEKEATLKVIEETPEEKKDRELKELLEKTKYIPLSQSKPKPVVEEDEDESGEDTPIPDDKITTGLGEQDSEKRKDLMEQKLAKKYGTVLHPRPDGSGKHRSFNIQKESIPGGGSMVICLDCGYIHRDSDMEGAK